MGSVSIEPQWGQARLRPQIVSVTLTVTKSSLTPLISPT